MPTLNPIRLGSSPEGAQLRPLVRGVAGGPAPDTDPYWDNVVLLLSFDGTNGSTTFTDESPKLHGDAAVLGNVHVSTASSCVVDESASGLFDGSVANLTFPDSDDWYWNDNIFTVEARIKPANISQFAFIVAHWGNLDIFQPTIDLSWSFYQDGAAIGFSYSQVGIDYTLFSGGAMVAGQCYNVAVSSNGANIWLYLDGVVVATHIAPDFYANASKVLAIGSNSETTHVPGGFFSGTENELRITKGIDRYGGATYTPITGPYPRTGP